MDISWLIWSIQSDSKLMPMDNSSLEVGSNTP